MILRFLSGSTTPARPVEEPLRRVHADDRQAEVAERLEDLPALVLAQEARVHEDAAEPLPHGLAQENRRDGRVDAARERAEDDARLQLLAQARDRRVAEARHRPRRLRAADVVEEVLEHLGAVLGVVDLRVALDAVEVRATRPRTPRRERSAVVAVTENPAGADSTWSPWLIQIVSTGPRPRKRRPPETFTCARPYSRPGALPTLPPKRCASHIIP